MVKTENDHIRFHLKQGGKIHQQRRATRHLSSPSPPSGFLLPSANRNKASISGAGTGAGTKKKTKGQTERHQFLC